MSQPKEVLKYCPYYYDIINFDFQEEDIISDKLITIYKRYIFNADITNPEELSDVKELDHIIHLYIEDYDFRKQMQQEIVKIKVKRDTNILKSIIDSIIKIFTRYEEYTTRKIYISKWI